MGIIFFLNFRTKLFTIFLSYVIMNYKLNIVYGGMQVGYRGNNKEH